MVYIVTDGSGCVKIGFARQLYQRMSVLQTGNPRKINLLITFETESLSGDKKLERILHSEFSSKRIELEGNRETEWFDDSILESGICNNTSDFLNGLCRKYCLDRNIKFSSEATMFDVEERRTDKMKRVLTSADIYAVG